MPPEALLFDMDGTLLDSERLWQTAQQRTMAYFGQTWTEQDQLHSIGGPLDRVVEHICIRTGGEPGHVARILVTEIEHEVATQPAFWMPGARELMLEAQAAGIPQAIVSNSWRVLLDLLVANIDVLPDITVSSTEVVKPKPDPEPYLAACMLLEVDPRRCVVLEDSPTGVTAGLRAGCTVVAIGPAVESLTDDRVVKVASLADISIASLGADRVEQAQARATPGGP